MYCSTAVARTAQRNAVPAGGRNPLLSFVRSEALEGCKKNKDGNPLAPFYSMSYFQKELNNVK
jgi:hypothetical protein